MFILKEDNTAELIREDGSIVDLPPYEVSLTSCGIHVTFPNGWVMSIQWGPSSYCEHHGEILDSLNYNEQGKLVGIKEPPRPWESKDAEIAAWDTKTDDQEDWYKFPNGDVVQGYLTVEEVVEYLILIGEQRNTIPLISEKASE